MAKALPADDAQTVARLESLVCLLDWLPLLPEPTRKRFLRTLAEPGDETRAMIAASLSLLKDPAATPRAQAQAMRKIAATLPLHPENDSVKTSTGDASNGARRSPRRVTARNGRKVKTQVDAFAARLRELMGAKQVSQHALAKRIGCSQPAISQLLQRQCRPLRKTIMKLAEALKVSPRELWPDLEVVDMLDAVASFQQAGYVMTDAEARSLRDPPKTGPSALPARLLPTRRVKRG